MALRPKAYAASGERRRVQIKFDEFERLRKNDLNIESSPDMAALKTRLLKVDNRQIRRSKVMSTPKIIVLPLSI